MTSHHKKGQNYLLAIGLIVLGFLFLLDNFDIIDVSDVWHLWPLILIAVGMLRLRTPIQHAKDEVDHNKSTCDYCCNAYHHDRNSGMMFIAVGTLLLLLNLDYLDWGDVWQFWPLILICIGCSIIYKYYKYGSEPRKKTPNTFENRIDAVAIFSGNEKIVTSDNFVGGTITTLFGGTEIDLRNVKLSDGENVIDVFTMFGGTEIKVPQDWNVIIKGLPIFGGFEDSRAVVTTGLKPNDQTLILKGFVMFGGLEIKNA